MVRPYPRSRANPAGGAEDGSGVASLAIGGPADADAVVEFPMPGPAERERIWRRSLPASAPLAEDLDLKALADRFEIAGGTICNAALSAGFLAAEAGTNITMAVALKGVHLELRKIGRLILE